MFIVTCQSNAVRAGCLVGFATQCGIEPPRYLVCLSIANRTYEIADSASGLAVHILTKKNEALAALFGQNTGDDIDKFEGVSWRPGVTGAPILTDCSTSFEGHVIAKIPFGDHVGFVLTPIEDLDADKSLDGRQLTLRDVKSFEPGHPA